MSVLDKMVDVEVDLSPESILSAMADIVSSGKMRKERSHCLVIDEDYQLTNKRLIFTYRNTINKISYNKFFRISIKDSMIRCFTEGESSLDVSLFYIIGLVEALSKYDELFHSNYLVDLVNNLSDLNFVHSLDDFQVLSSEIKRYLYMNNDISESTIKQRARIDNMKSLYLGSACGVSLLTPHSLEQQDCVSMLFILLLSEEGKKVVAGLLSRYMVIINRLGMYLLLGLDNTNDLSYKPKQLSSSILATDVKGLSLYLVLKLCSELVTGCTDEDMLCLCKLSEKIEDLDSRDEDDIKGEFLDLSLENSFLLPLLAKSGEIDKLIFENLGNDYFAKYIKKGSVTKFLSVWIDNTFFDYGIGDLSFKVSDCCLDLLVEGIKDINKYGIKMKSPCMGVALLSYTKVFSYLTRFVGSDEFIHNLEEGYSENCNKLKLELKRSEQDRNRLKRDNTRLKNELQSLREEVKSVDKVGQVNVDSLFKEYENKNIDLTNTVNELRSELNDCKCTLSDLISSLQDEEEVSSSKSDISLKDKVAFLNNFTIGVLGGRSEFTSRLYDIGLYSVVQYETCKDVKRGNNLDFVVTMTKFVAHNMVYTMLTRLNFDRDRHLYFNGTNVEAFINSCYDFINKYFEI